MKMDGLLAKALEPKCSHLLGYQAVPTSHFWPQACPRTTVQKTATASYRLGKVGSFCCLATLKGGIPPQHSNPGLLVLWHCDTEFFNFFFFLSLSFLLCKTEGDNSYLGFWEGTQLTMYFAHRKIVIACDTHLGHSAITWASYLKYHVPPFPH